VTVDSLTTTDGQYGCRSWSSSYQLTRLNGRWEIARVSISPSPCQGSPAGTSPSSTGAEGNTGNTGNTRVGPAAFKSVEDRGGELDLAALPDVPLEEASLKVRDEVARLVANVARWDGFAASVATKVLHKKRPALIPILDNQAIFGAYLNPRWPDRRSSVESVYAQSRIREALECIWIDLTRAANDAAWSALADVEPTRSRIELFDMVWWMHFRRLEPVPPVSPV
jgi:hypothetical protein